MQNFKTHDVENRDRGLGQDRWLNRLMGSSQPSPLDNSISNDNIYLRKQCTDLFPLKKTTYSQKSQKATVC
jgi:hypothetical protein